LCEALRAAGATALDDLDDTFWRLRYLQNPVLKRNSAEFSGKKEGYGPSRRYHIGLQTKPRSAGK
jgi:hypothetical protein